MGVLQELIRLEEDNSLSFGNYLLDEKKKVLDFEVDGDLYYLKTFKEITKLKKNGNLLVEVVPGASIYNFNLDQKNVTFLIESFEDLQITLELEPSKEYKIFINDVNVGKVKANMSGKINFSVEIDGINKETKVRLEKMN